MTKRTRYFMTGSALILGLGLCTGLVAYYNGDLPRFRSRIGPEDFAYVPMDATGVAYANVREIMNSDFHQKLQRSALPIGQGKQDFFNETGIDLEHDIDSVVAASNNQIGAGGQGVPGIVLIRGRFDEGRIETLIRQHNGTVQDYKGKRLLIISTSSQGDNGPCLTFPETGLALIGPTEEVKRAIDTRAGHENITGNQELMKFVSQMDGAGNTAWAVGGLDAVARDANLPPQIKDNIPGIQWIAVSAHINGGVNGLLHAEARDDKAAEDLRAVVNGAIAAARMMGGKDQKLDAVVNSLQLTGTGKELQLAFTVPPEILEGMTGLKSTHDHLPTPEKPQDPAPNRQR
jgi:hypothetical protein